MAISSSFPSLHSPNSNDDWVRVESAPDESAPLLEAGSQTNYQADSSGQHATDTSSAAPSASASYSRFFLKHLRSGGGAESNTEKEMTFQEIEKYIRDIGTEDLNYLKTLGYRAPKLGKETKTVVKEVATSLAGTATAYAMGNALGLPTGYLFGPALGETIGRYYKSGISAFEQGERPLGQEFFQKWEHLKKILKPALDKLDEKSKVAAKRLENYGDFYAKDFTKLNTTSEVTSATLDGIRPYILRYAFIICINSLTTKNVSAREVIDLVASSKFSKRVQKFEESKRHQIETLEQKIRTISIADQNPGLPVVQFLGGPGGTGKTSIVKMLAERIGLPLIEITLANTPIEMLRGIQDVLVTEKEEKSLDEMVGQLAVKIARCGVNNPIVFFDEAEQLNDRDMSTFMKTLLQDKPVLKIPSLDTELDLSRVTFIFAANRRIEDSALAQRLPEIAFSGLSKAEKLDAANEVFTKEINGIRKRSGDILADNVLHIATPMLDYIANMDMQRNSGGRVIQHATRNFVTAIETRLKNTPAVVLERPDLETMVGNIYLAYPPEESSNERVDPAEKEPALKFITVLKGKVENIARDKAGLELLEKNVKQSQIQLNDFVMLLLANALGNQDQRIKITDTAQQASALYLIGALAKVCGRTASTTEKTTLALHKCLRGLMAALESNVTDPACRLKLLVTVHNVINMLPSENSRRQKTIIQLAMWKDNNPQIGENLRNKIDEIIRK